MADNQDVSEIESVNPSSCLVVPTDDPDSCDNNSYLVVPLHSGIIPIDIRSSSVQNITQFPNSITIGIENNEENNFCGRDVIETTEQVLDTVTLPDSRSLKFSSMLPLDASSKQTSKRKSYFDLSGESKQRKVDDLFRSYISDLIDKDRLKPGGLYKHVISNIDHKLKPDVKDYLMLDVIYWDLPAICSAKNVKLKLSCPECGAKLSVIPLGPKKRFMMRKLYGLHEPIMLITTMFRCSSAQRHEVLGYDPRLLRMLPRFDTQFLLFHRAGTTRELVDSILQDATKGIKIRQIQSHLNENYITAYGLRSKAYESSCEAYLSRNSSIHVTNLLKFPAYKTQCPSITMVTQCCLTAFKEKEEFYRLCMSQVKAENFIYFDDSFQVASNLQTPKIYSEKAVQFKRVMYVTNEQGQIMTWQLVKDNAYKEIASVMTMVKNDHEKLNISLIGCCTNRCCEWSHEFKQTFGEHFIVKGNLTLSIECISENMPTDTEARSECLRCLELVFRQDGDKGSERRQNTADATTIQNNLDDFLMEWKDLKSHNGSNIISSTALKEIYSLDRHIANGCFSDIPVVPIINPVDGFLKTHLSLQKWVANARIGIPLAMALFSIGFHQLNLERGVVDITEIETESEQIPRNLKSNDCMKLAQVINILGNAVAKGSSLLKDGENADQMVVFTQIFMYIKSYQSIAHFVPDVLIAPRLIPYFLSPLHLITSPCFRKNEDKLSFEYMKGVDELKTCISKPALKNNQVNESTLSAVVSYLKTYYDLHADKTSTKEYYDMLCQQGLNFAEQYVNIVSTLSERVTLGYEILTFWDALSTLSNIFGVVIFLITSFKRFPVLPVYPKCWNRNSPSIFLLLRDDNCLPIFLDLSSVSSTMISPLESQGDSRVKNFRCRCGRGKAEGNQLPKCITSDGQRYPSRCLCFRAGEACTSLCDCRACSNPHGSNVSKSQLLDPITGKRTRKRHAHDGQNLFREILSRVPSRLTSNKNSWNSIECLLFELTLSIFVLESNDDLDLLPRSNLALKLIHEKYCSISQTLLRVEGIENIANMKSVSDVEQKLVEREEDILGCLEIFENSTT